MEDQASSDFGMLREMPAGTIRNPSGCRSVQEGEQSIDIECPVCQRDSARRLSRLESVQFVICPYCSHEFFYFFEDVGESLKHLEQMLEGVSKTVTIDNNYANF
jgi:Zn ribbon nucleic-acid-binding protein